jgi:hypothetical protein
VVYSHGNNTCVSSPPFYGESGVLILRYDWSHGQNAFHINFKEQFEQNHRNRSISSIQIDDGQPFLTMNFRLDPWSVADFVEDGEIERFFSEFKNGHALLIFLSNKELLTIKFTQIAIGPERFIDGFRRCGDDHSRGINHRGAY